MAEWEKMGESDEWYTPPEIFAALNTTFDLDVASPGTHHWVPARKVYTEKENGLTSIWGGGGGRVWMNPPFGGRNGQVPWLRKFISHGDGIGLVAARTSAKWFQDLIPQCHAILFPRGKTKFVRPDGSIGKSPGSGVVLIAMGEDSCEILRASKLGIYLRIGS